MKNIKDPNEKSNLTNKSYANENLYSRGYYGTHLTDNILYTKTSYVPKESLL